MFSKSLLIFMMMLNTSLCFAQSAIHRNTTKSTATGTKSNTVPKSTHKAAKVKNELKCNPQPPFETPQTFTVNGVSFNMIPVEGGIMTIGSVPDPYYFYKNRTVAINGFAIGQTEVTQELWTAVMGDNPSYHKGYNYPVESVNWADCQLFIEKLNKMTGQKFRLPYEKEWEYAARGGKLTHNYYYSGSNNIGDVAWNRWGKAQNCETTMPVGQKMPNELGIYDMSGNVEEWCHDSSDKFDRSFKNCKVAKGGCVTMNSQCCYVGYIDVSTLSTGRSKERGFRIVL